MKTTINVTAERIADGYPDNCEWCPVALAATAAFGQPVVVVVDQRFSERLDGKILSIDYSKLVARLPDWVSSRIHTFDKTGKMEPFSFEVELL